MLTLTVQFQLHTRILNNALFLKRLERGTRCARSLFCPSPRARNLPFVWPLQYVGTSVYCLRIQFLPQRKQDAFPSSGLNITTCFFETLVPASESSRRQNPERLPHPRENINITDFRGSLGISEQRSNSLVLCVVTEQKNTGREFKIFMCFVAGSFCC